MQKLSIQIKARIDMIDQKSIYNTIAKTFLLTLGTNINK